MNGCCFALTIRYKLAAPPLALHDQPFVILLFLGSLRSREEWNCSKSLVPERSSSARVRLLVGEVALGDQEASLCACTFAEFEVFGFAQREKDE